MNKPYVDHMNELNEIIELLGINEVLCAIKYSMSTEELARLNDYLKRHYDLD